MPSLAGAPTDALLVCRADLLRGLDEVARHLDAGTFTSPRPAGGVPPSEAGCVVLMLLERIDGELIRRGALATMAA